MKALMRGTESVHKGINRLIDMGFNLFFLSVFSFLIIFTGMLFFRLPENFYSRVSALSESLKQVPGGLSSKVKFLWANTVEIEKLWSLALPEIKEVTISSGIFSVIASIIMLIFIAYIGGKFSKDKHLRGQQTTNLKSVKKVFVEEVKKEAREIYEDTGAKVSVNEMLKDPFIASVSPYPPPGWIRKVKSTWTEKIVNFLDGMGLPIYDSIEGRHVSFVGPTGTGKSTLIKHWISKNMAKGNQGIIIDINGEFYSEFGREQDVILSLKDKRSVAWDYGNEANPAEIAKYLIEPGKEPFFSKGAKVVLRNLLEENNADELWDLIDDEDDEKLRECLQGISKKIIGAKGSGQEAGIIGNTVLEMTWLEQLNYWARKSGKDEPFSVMDWAKNGSDKWIFVVFSDEDKEEIQPLLRIWFNLAILGLLKRPSYNKLPKIDFIIDEINSVGKLDLLPTLLERGRKPGGRAKLGAQTKHTWIKQYGEQDAKTIDTNISCRFIFRTSEPREAQDYADLCSTSEVLRKSSSGGLGAKGDKGADETIQESITEVKNVLPSEIMALSDGHFYMRALGLPPLKARIRKHRWPQVNPLHEEMKGEVSRVDAKKGREDYLTKRKKRSQTLSLEYPENWDFDSKSTAIPPFPEDWKAQGSAESKDNGESKYPQNWEFMYA